MFVVGAVQLASRVPARLAVAPIKSTNEKEPTPSTQRAFVEAIRDLPRVRPGHACSRRGRLVFERESAVAPVMPCGCCGIARSASACKSTKGMTDADGAHGDRHAITPQVTR